MRIAIFLGFLLLAKSNGLHLGPVAEGIVWLLIGMAVMDVLEFFKKMFK